MTIYGLFDMKVHPKIYGMTKMLKMQKIPNLLLLVGRDDQLVYLMLSPYEKIKLRMKVLQDIMCKSC
jgi:hypothetical protein